MYKLKFCLIKYFSKSIRLWCYSMYLAIHSEDVTLSQKCPYSEFFQSIFPGIWSEYGDSLCKSPYSARIRENVDQQISNMDIFTQCKILHFLKFKQQSCWIINPLMHNDQTHFKNLAIRFLKVCLTILGHYALKG